MRALALQLAMLGVAAFGHTACTDSAPTTLLDGPRVVAVIADPPSVRFDGTTFLTLVTALDGAATQPEAVRWRACSPATLVVDPIRDCAGELAEPLQVDASGRAEVDMAALAQRFGVPVPPNEADDVCGRSVVPLTIVVEAQLAGARLVATKQVHVGAAAPPRTNPQFLHVLADNTALSARSSFAPNQTVTLSTDLARDSLDQVCEPGDPAPTRHEAVRVAVYAGGGATASDIGFDVVEVNGATIAGTVELTMPAGPARVPLWLVAVDEGGGVAVSNATLDVR